MINRTIAVLLTFIVSLPLHAQDQEQELALNNEAKPLKVKSPPTFSTESRNNFSPSASHKTNAEKRELTNGFYPLVEGTGYVPRANTLQMAWNQITYSLMDGVNIGTQPALFVFRTPNFFIKARLYQDARQSLAVNLGTNVLLKNSGKFFTTFYSSPIHNPNSSVYVVPLTLSHSYKLNRFITVHQTISDVNVMAERDIEEKATLGYSGMLELKARDNHSVFVHGSEVGFWDHNYYYAGISYRYSSKSFFTQLGYFYRVQTEGVQVLPLFDIGFML